MAKSKAEIACAPYVDAWRDGFKAGHTEGFQWCLDLVRAAWMDSPDKRIEQIGKDIAEELKRRQGS